MGKRPHTDWTPAMIADFKKFWEERYGKRIPEYQVRAEVELDVGV